MASETVSVVVPVYNGSAFVRECWQSLRAQTHPPAEVWFVDDGSTDDTLQRLAELEAGEILVRVVSQPRSGPAAARNAALARVRGEFVAFLDIDDLWPATKLERALREFRARPELQVVGGLVAIDRMPGGAGRSAAALETPHRRVNLGAFVFRAALFVRHGVLEPTLLYGEDVEYMSRLRQAGVEFLDLDEVTLRYRLHAGNMTRGRGAKELGLFDALARSLVRARVVGAAGEGESS